MQPDFYGDAFFLLVVLIAFVGSLLVLGAGAWCLDRYLGWLDRKRGKYLCVLKGADFK